MHERLSSVVVELDIISLLPGAVSNFDGRICSHHRHAFCPPPLKKKKKKKKE
jgi:hypothetical protein